MTSIAAAPADGYRELAPFYDAFTSGSDYERWTGQILALLASHGWSGRTVLDVACGTGKSFEPLLRRGFEVTACDRSAAMLAQAARKAPEVRLFEADVRDLPAGERFDLVTCFDDSLNHLLAEDELAAAFDSLAGALAGDGLLAFDLNTLLAYRTTFASSAAHDSDGHLFVWRGGSTPDAAPGCRATARIDVFAREDDLYARVVSRHEQRHHPPHRVVELLRGAGLECLGVHGVLADGALADAVDESTHLKVLYLARLAERR